MNRSAGRLQVVRWRLIPSTTFLAALAWTVALMLEPGTYDPFAVFLIGLGLLGTGTVAVIGLVVSGGRWSHRLGLVTLAGSFAVALLRPLDVTWVVALASTTLATVVWFLPAVTRNVRKLPAAAGPPPEAVVPPLLLLTAPLLLGISSFGSASWPVLVAGAAAPVAAFGFSRVLPGGLIGLRVVWPLLAIALAPTMGLSTGLVSAFLAVATVGLSWRPGVKTSYHPPTERGSTFPIPAELTPEDVLEAADLDDRGRRR